MWDTINHFVNTNIGTSILICAFLFLILFAIIRVWLNMAELFGDLYDAGWDNFKQQWKEWRWLKRIAVILMYIIVLLGFVIYVIFMTIVVIITLGAIMKFLKRDCAI